MKNLKTFIETIKSRKSNFTIAQRTGALVLTAMPVMGLASALTEGESTKSNVATYSEADSITANYNKLIETLGFVTYDSIKAYQFLATMDAYQIDGKVPAEFQSLVDANNYAYVEKLARLVRSAMMNAYLDREGKEVPYEGLLTNATEDQLALLEKSKSYVNAIRQAYYALGEDESMITNASAVDAYNQFLALIPIARMVLTSGQYTMIFRDQIYVMYAMITNDTRMYDHYALAFEGMGTPNDFMVNVTENPRESTINFTNEDLAVMYDRMANKTYCK